MHKKKIYLAILNEGTVRVELIKTIMQWQMNGEYEIYLSFPNDKPIESNRNKIVQDFLKTDCEWLVQIDDDVVPPVDYLNLITYDKDVISGVCYAYRQDAIVPLVLFKNKKDGLWKNKEINPSDGLIEVDSMGTGAMMIHRRVFVPELQKHPFQSTWRKDGTRRKGLDLYFCEKAKKLGFKIWCHLRYDCSHIVSADLKEINKGFTIRDVMGGAIDNNLKMRRFDGQEVTSKRKKFVEKIKQNDTK